MRICILLMALFGLDPLIRAIFVTHVYMSVKCKKKKTHTEGVIASFLQTQKFGHLVVLVTLHSQDGIKVALKEATD